MCIQYEDLSAPKKPIPIVQQLFLPYLSVCKIQNNMLIQIKSSSRRQSLTLSECGFVTENFS